MSPTYAAALARACLFQLEALEPRRLLSAEGGVDGAIAIDVDQGVELRGVYDSGPNSTPQAVFSFAAEAGRQYIFTNGENQNDFALLDEGGTFLRELYDFNLWKAPRSGQFYLRASYSYEDMPAQQGYYITARPLIDDFGNTKAEATTLGDDTSISGHVDGFEDEDWFKFDVKPGMVYHLKRSGSDLRGGVLTIYAPDGTTIQRDDEYREDPFIKNDAGGTYYMQVTTDRKVWHPANLYTLTLDVFADDAGDSPPTAAAWDVSRPISGELEYDGDKDYFAFEAEAGYGYIFNSEGAKEIYLRDSQDNLLGHGSSLVGAYAPGQGRLFWVAPRSGTFYISVEPYVGFLLSFATGSYSLSASVISREQLAAAPTISHQQIISGTTSGPQDVHFYRVEGKIDSLYSFSMPFDPAGYEYAGFHSAPVPILMQFAGAKGPFLYDGDNITGSISGTSMLTASGGWIAPESGTSYLAVSTFNDSPSPFEITFKESRDDHGNDPARATPIALGEVVEGNVNYDEDRDYFSFPGVAGRTYAIVGDFADDQAWVTFDDSLANIGPGYQVSTFGNRTRLTFVAPQTGIYRLKVSGDSFEHPLDPAYQLRVVELSPAYPLADAPTISAEQTITDQFDAPGQIRFYRFDIEENRKYRFTLPRKSIATAWYTVDEMGQINERPGSWTPWLLSTPELFWGRENKTVYLAITAFDPAEMGDFDLHLRVTRFNSSRPRDDLPLKPGPQDGSEDEDEESPELDESDEGGDTDDEDLSEEEEEAESASNFADDWDVSDDQGWGWDEQGDDSSDWEDPASPLDETSDEDVWMIDDELYG